MEISLPTERLLTELDYARLTALARDHGGAMAEALDAASVVPGRAVPPDIVTMYSQVALADCASGRRWTLTVCYPADAEPSAGFVSVLSPVGSSLLGRRVGETVRWPLPDGTEGAARVLDILFQPEASGDYRL